MCTHNMIKLASIVLSIIGRLYQQCLHSIIGQRLSIICQCLSIMIAAILFIKPCIVVNDITKGTPTYDTSLKWLKVTVSTQKHLHTFQEGSYSKKSTENKTLTYLKAIFPVDSVSLQVCGYTILNTFAHQ